MTMIPSLKMKIPSWRSWIPMRNLSSIQKMKTRTILSLRRTIQSWKNWSYFLSLRKTIPNLTMTNYFPKTRKMTPNWKKNCLHRSYNNL